MVRFLPAVLLLASSAWADDLDSQIKRLVDAYALIEQNSADPISSEQVFYQGVIPGMLRRLDPHSVFFDPQQFEQLKQLETSTRKGFGTVVSVLPGRVIVLQALPGTPSAKSGLSPGDEILAVNNVALNRLEFDQIIGFLTEARQHQVKLDVRRPGNARLLQFVLDPELVDSPSVDRAFLLRPGVGYVRVNAFEVQTAKQLKQAIDGLGGAK